jgi:hypothetical protein
MPMHGDHDKVNATYDSLARASRSSRRKIGLYQDDRVIRAVGFERPHCRAGARERSSEISPAPRAQTAGSVRPGVYSRAAIRLHPYRHLSREWH